jgi:hypothetical protein
MPSTFTPASSLRSCRLAAGAVLAALVAGCMGGPHAAMPASLDQAPERLTEQAAFRVSYRSEPSPVPVNRLHAWTVHVETPDGRAVTDATLTVDGDMPQHRHGMPTRARMTRNLGGGDYLVEGMKFQMGGWWAVDLTVDAGERRDVARFNLLLQR